MLDEFGLPMGPNADFWFGADQSGRDVFVRILYGARTSLLVAIVATGIAVVIGVVLGLISGYFRGFTDTIISRAIDIILALPLLLFAIGIVAACGTSKEGCFGGLIQPGLSPRHLHHRPLQLALHRAHRPRERRSRSARRSSSRRAARSAPGNVRIMFREVLPNLVAPIIVYTTLLIPANILFEAALSFLGARRAAETRRPGGRCSRTQPAIFEVAWWLMLFPGLFLIATTLAFNLLGDGLRDALDPRTGR